MLRDSFDTRLFICPQNSSHVTPPRKDYYVIESTLPNERPLDIRESSEFIAIAQRVREGYVQGIRMNETYSNMSVLILIIMRF